MRNDGVGERDEEDTQWSEFFKKPNLTVFKISISLFQTYSTNCKWYICLLEQS